VLLPALAGAASLGLPWAEAQARRRQALKGSPPPRDARWIAARPDYRWAFPRDHWSHPGYRTEWWYFTGHLSVRGDTAPRFGYQFTLFRVGVALRAPAWASAWATEGLVMGHAAVTDLAAGRHRFSETLVRAVPLLGGFGAPGDALVGWSRAPAGTDGRWTLRWTGSGFAFTAADARAGLALDLVTEPARPVTLQGPNGYSRKGAAPDNASLYYSFTRLATRGTVVAGRDTFAVTGTTWMDKEFGSSQLDSAAVGWDWFSLQLEDGRDLMLYQLRDSAGLSTWSAGTVVPADRGGPRYLAAAAYRVRVTAHWSSRASGARYPARWTIEIPSESLVLDVVPLLADQENRSAAISRLFYWEGAVEVREPGGRAVGRGYVELTGYGTSLKPAL